MKNLRDLPVSKKRTVYSFVFPFFILVLLWLVFFVSATLHFDLTSWGIFPRRLSGLKGIIFAPFIHAGFKHLASNSLPLFFLMAGTIYFYRDLGYKVILYVWLMGGSWVWIAARPAYHIGASGIVYGLASFLFFSGILRKYVPLIAISLLVVFLYGSMIWGIFPLVEEISWESHLLGALAGFILAIVYRKEGPQRPPASWEREGEENPDEIDFNNQGYYPKINTPAMKPEGIIFDLDGVITDTAAVHASAWKKMFDDFLASRHQKPAEDLRKFSPEDYRQFVDGKPRYEGVDAFLKSRNILIPFGHPNNSPDAETICGLGNRKNQLFNTIVDKEGVRVYDSSVRLIRSLHDEGIPLAVASSSKNCRTVLEKTGLLPFFGACIGGLISAEKNLNGKPEPDIFLYAAKMLHVSPEHSVVIEDAVSGVKAGKKGNFGLVIGVAREGNEAELLEAGADWVVRDLNEVSLIKIRERLDREK